MAGSHEVRGSIPLGSTINSTPLARAAFFVSGARPSGPREGGKGRGLRMLFRISDCPFPYSEKHTFLPHVGSIHGFLA